MGWKQAETNQSWVRLGPDQGAAEGDKQGEEGHQRVCAGHAFAVAADAFGS